MSRKLIGSAILIVLTALFIVNGCAVVHAADPLKQQFDQTVPDLLADYKVPGVAIGVVRQGEIAFIRTYGHADKAAETPISEDTLFNVGSVSKIATAWGVMQLVEQGKIDLDEPISNYLDQPDFRDSEFDAGGITARRLLSHTAGLSMHSIPGFRIPKPLPTLLDIFQGKYQGNVYAKPGSALQLVAPPGSKWQYSGGGTMILQLLIEETTGSSFRRHMYESVLHPLNMKQSQFGWSEEISRQIAVPYSPKGRARKTYRFTGTSGAGLYSTIGDMSRFAAAGLKSSSGEVGRGVLRSESVAQMYNPVTLNDGTQCRCGLGYFVDRRSGATPLRVHHDGSNYGWRAELIAVPETNDAVVILSNSDNAIPFMERIVCLWGKATFGVDLPGCD
jgi:CubicO group peptidase (beta-lactamase class C family)